MGNADPEDRGVTRAGGERLPAHAVTPEFISAQYRVIREGLEEHLDHRLEELLSEKLPPAEDRSRGRSSILRTVSRFRPEIYLALLLIVMIDLGRRLDRAGGPASEGTVEGSAGLTGRTPMPGDSAGQRHSDTPKSEEGSSEPERDQTPSLEEIHADPADAWREFGEADRDRFREWLEAIADARGLKPDQVSNGQKRRFREYGERITRGTKVTNDMLGHSRKGLFEYCYGLYELDQRGKNSPGFMVTLDFSDYDREVLNRWLNRLGLPRDLEKLEPTDPAFQVAILTRHMARETP